MNSKAERGADYGNLFCLLSSLAFGEPNAESVLPKLKSAVVSSPSPRTRCTTFRNHCRNTSLIQHIAFGSAVQGRRPPDNTERVRGRGVSQARGDVHIRAGICCGALLARPETVFIPNRSISEIVPGTDVKALHIESLVAERRLRAVERRGSAGKNSYRSALRVGMGTRA